MTSRNIPPPSNVFYIVFALYIFARKFYIQLNLDKIHWDRAHAMLVAPEWFWEGWWHHWKNMVAKAYYFDQPMYLSTDGHLRDMPKWCTIISVVDGNRHNHDHYHHSTDTERAPDWVYSNPSTHSRRPRSHSYSHRRRRPSRSRTPPPRRPASCYSTQMSRTLLH